MHVAVVGEDVEGSTISEIGSAVAFRRVLIGVSKGPQADGKLTSTPASWNPLPEQKSVHFWKVIAGSVKDAPERPRPEVPSAIHALETQPLGTAVAAAARAAAAADAAEAEADKDEATEAEAAIEAAREVARDADAESDDATDAEATKEAARDAAKDAETEIDEASEAEAAMEAASEVA